MPSGASNKRFGISQRPVKVLFVWRRRFPFTANGAFAHHHDTVGRGTTSFREGFQQVDRTQGHPDPQVISVYLGQISQCTSYLQAIRATTVKGLCQFVFGNWKPVINIQLESSQTLKYAVSGMGINHLLHRLQPQRPFVALHVLSA
jgi:hypothetical protein